MSGALFQVLTLAAIVLSLVDLGHASANSDNAFSVDFVTPIIRVLSYVSAGWCLIFSIVLILTRRKLFDFVLLVCKKAAGGNCFSETGVQTLRYPLTSAKPSELGKNCLHFRNQHKILHRRR